MKQKVLSLVVAGCLLSGCAAKHERLIASGSFQYLEASEYKTFEVPENLDQPAFSNQYALPQIDQDTPAELLGERLRVASPRLILPLVKGTHVEEGSEDAKVLFDQIDDNEPLQKTVWDTVLSYLEKNQIGVENFDQENNVLLTDWVITNYELDGKWYELGEKTAQTARKYEFSLTLAPHGRTAALATDMVDYLDANGNRVLNSIDPITLRAEEATFLNNVIAEYDFGIRLATTQRIAKIRQGFSTDMGFDADGEPALVIDAVYENTWPRLLLVLRKMGFDVKDLDQSNGLLFVQYNGSDVSWWDNIFSGGKDLELDKQEYRLKVAKVGAKTAVTFMDDQSQIFNADQISNIYAPFAEYMATEDLDI